LGRYIDSLFQEYPKGCAIVFKPKTGEVLALYSAPGFDLNLLTGITEKEEFLKIMGDTLKPFLNRCIQGIYSPGSIFKIITALIALELGLIDTTEFITCKGRYSFGNRVFKDWKEEGHGKVNFLKAIEVSCDVYFYEISKRIGLKRYIEFLKELNIFKKTEIDLPEEKKGFYPTIDFYIKKYGKYGYGEGNVLNLGIGQGEILMTPMQITLMIGAVALGGKCKKPHVLKDKQTLDFVLKFREENIELVKKGLYRVVNGKKGTGRLARHDRVHIAGKTGTSQNPFGKDHALFSCFFPYEDPDYVVFVLLENAGMGGEKAAPLAGKISKRIIDLYGVK
jgi:penicillin-binding protein 2